jgi:hypothetical protein
MSVRGNATPRGMTAHDRIRLTGPSAGDLWRPRDNLGFLAGKSVAQAGTCVKCAGNVPEAVPELAQRRRRAGDGTRPATCRVRGARPWGRGVRGRRVPQRRPQPPGGAPESALRPGTRLGMLRQAARLRSGTLRRAARGGWGCAAIGRAPTSKSTGHCRTATAEPLSCGYKRVRLLL